jgi:hypothetical protein
MTSFTEQKLIELSLAFCPKINLACHQNDMALLKELTIHNPLTESFEDLTLTLTCDPQFFRPKTWQLDRLGSESSIRISDRSLTLNGGFLLQLTEATRGQIELTLSQGETVLSSTSSSVELLAHNEWGGAGYMPELLAAFVMPNSPAVDRVLGSASQILRRSNKSPSLDGYRSNSRTRIWEMASAIYSAVANERITYALPPSSFERDGQKIRTPEQILQNKVATCLDTTLLFASAFEQAGLNPVVILQKDHAFVGVWLQPEKFALVLTEEADAVRKRSQLNELLIFETTFVTQNPTPPFSKAVEQAKQTLLPENDDKFEVVLDVKRARVSQIRPLGFTSEQTVSTEEEKKYPVIVDTFEEPPELPDFSPEISTDNDTLTGQSRLEQWQKKLLNLSLTNPLLNHKSAKGSLKILCPEPEKLEDLLADNQAFSLISTEKALNSRADKDLYLQRTGEALWKEEAKEAMAHKQLLVDAPQGEMEKRLVDIYRKAKLALEEGGANTLYLAIGFLVWRSQDKKDSTSHRAPLILLPISLERSSVKGGIKLKLYDDEPRFNTTLLEMLKQDFEVTLPGLEGELPTDDSGLDVPAIWNMVRLAVKEIPGFEVIEDVVLGHFSFAKYLMWKDLIERSEDLKKRPCKVNCVNAPSVYSQ